MEQEQEIMKKHSEYKKDTVEIKYIYIYLQSRKLEDKVEEISQKKDKEMKNCEKIKN